MAKLGLRMNTRNQGVSQYINYDFDSIVEFNGQVIGFNSNGIHQLFAGNDDNGAKIYARFDLPLTNMGTMRNKWLRAVYLSLSADGKIQVTAKDDEHFEHTYEAIPLKLNKQHIVRVTGGRNFNKGSHYSFSIENVDGSDFDIDTIQAVPMKGYKQPGKF